jgi:hypothetical protein
MLTLANVDQYLGSSTVSIWRMHSTSLYHVHIKGTSRFSFRDALRVDIRKLPKDASAAQKAVVEEKQQKLAARISQFHEVADAMTEGIEVDAGTEHMDDTRFCAADMEEEAREAEDTEVASEETGEEVAAEAMGI